MVLSANLGYPRIGPDRELKKALEACWSGKASEQELLGAGQSIKKANWTLQKEAGLDHIPSNDFSLYDHVLDAACVVGAVPERFGKMAGSVNLSVYFAMARGTQSAAPMEMTKWFDTNYHYIVPEIGPEQKFYLASRKPIEEFLEAKALGIQTRPVILGPVSFLLLSKPVGGFDLLGAAGKLTQVYEELLSELAAAGADWVQIDEPCLALDLPTRILPILSRTYGTLSRVSKNLKIMLASYFGSLGENLTFTLGLPTAGLHLDFVRAPSDLSRALRSLPKDKVLSAGIVDGRNIWKTDIAGILDFIEPAAKSLGPDRLMIAPSCSLIHCPIDLSAETKLDEELLNWLAFARQKLEEIVGITRALNEGRDAVRHLIAGSSQALEQRKNSSRRLDPRVRERMASLSKQRVGRKSPYGLRRKLQDKILQLPALPTTMIGSLPQTSEVRSVRADWKAGRIDESAYEEFLRKEIAKAVKWQEEIGLDVLVHGEFERTDMVEHFGAQLQGVAITRNGWVQSYGSRYTKPPIIYGDISRPGPMTVKWAKFAKTLTKRPLKGMLTGPITILQWSFVRDDQPRSETCRQIALAIRDEVLDLESEGLKIIQVDEPALREGLPLRKKDWGEYLAWAVVCFRLTHFGVKDETQIHTHMCYAQFQDILGAIVSMDADVISIEAARSRMELIESFKNFRYPNAIGPGVYDIHSPRIPAQREMEDLIIRALKVIAPEQLWINPDCGLKTRQWPEVRPSIEAMVKAAHNIRKRLKNKKETETVSL